MNKTKKNLEMKNTINKFIVHNVRNKMQPKDHSF